MKLSYEDKQGIYKLRKSGVSWPQISQRYGVCTSNLKYMVKLMDRYGVEIVEKGKNRYYSPELKQEIMDNVLIHGRSQPSVSLNYALSNLSTNPFHSLLVINNKRALQTLRKNIQS